MQVQQAMDRSVAVVEDPPRGRLRRRLNEPPAPLPPPRPSPLSLTEEERAQDWLRWRPEHEAMDAAEEARKDPASIVAMGEMQMPAAGETRETECAICLGELFRVAVGCKYFKKKVRMMPCCSSSFHQSCIWDLLQDDRRCPACDVAMPSGKRRRIQEEEMDNQRLRLARVNIN